MKKSTYRVFIKKYIWAILIIAVLVGVQTVLSLISPLIIQKYIDSDIEYNYLVILAISYLVISLLLYGVKLLVTYNSENLGWKITNELRVSLLKK